MARHSEKVKEARKHAVLAFKATQDELRSAIKDRAEIEEHIRTLQQDLMKLAPMCGVSPVDPITKMGVTNAVRFVIAHAFMALDMSSIKAIILGCKVKLPDSNPTAAVQTTVRRLLDNGEIKDVSEEGKESEFEWTGKMPPPIPPILDWMLTDINEEALNDAAENDSYPF